jgi:hypothetical protein
MISQVGYLQVVGEFSRIRLKFRSFIEGWKIPLNYSRMWMKLTENVSQSFKESLTTLMPSEKSFSSLNFPPQQH